ncbi:uncharacterized protein B0H18DRAFT_963558 [Fomitopsis serialis]|uniref:uncharacterized protein n=1 Tax=Fomitopsis serialis TaxID=139415 RepID=UPI0020074148|nr:uncharacterized protein B0H18DRAFT_963558 [Neoantrodia serialis]KAH9910265.1 hypothetical protein B0H18DRAFT_963558 [Neoantrodia serialis]
MPYDVSAAVERLWDVSAIFRVVRRLPQIYGLKQDDVNGVDLDPKALDPESTCYELSGERSGVQGAAAKARAQRGSEARYNPAGPRYQFRTPVLRAVGLGPSEPGGMVHSVDVTTPEAEVDVLETRRYTETLHAPGWTPSPSAAATQREYEPSGPWRLTAPFTQAWPVDRDQDGDVDMDVNADEHEDGRRREEASVVPPRHNKRTRQSARLGAECLSASRPCKLGTSPVSPESNWHTQRRLRLLADPQCIFYPQSRHGAIAASVIARRAWCTCDHGRPATTCSGRPSHTDAHVARAPTFAARPKSLPATVSHPPHCFLLARSAIMVGRYDLQQFTMVQFSALAKRQDLTDAARNAVLQRVYDNAIFDDVAPKPKEWNAAKLKALNRLLRSLLNSAVSWQTFQHIVEYHILRSGKYDQFPQVLARCYDWQYPTPLPPEGKFPDTMEEYFDWRGIKCMTYNEDSTTETLEDSFTLFMKQWIDGPPLSYDTDDYRLGTAHLVVLERVTDAEREEAKKELAKELAKQKKKNARREHSPPPPEFDTVLFGDDRCETCVAVPLVHEQEGQMFSDGTPLAGARAGASSLVTARIAARCTAPRRFGCALPGAVAFAVTLAVPVVLALTVSFAGPLPLPLAVPVPVVFALAFALAGRLAVPVVLPLPLAVSFRPSSRSRSRSSSRSRSPSPSQAAVANSRYPPRYRVLLDQGSRSSQGLAEDDDEDHRSSARPPSRHTGSSRARTPSDSLSGEMEVDSRSAGRSSPVDAMPGQAGPSNVERRGRAKRQRDDELDIEALTREVERSAGLSMAERLDIHYAVIGKLVGEVARLRGAVRATQNKRVRYTSEEV